MKENERDLLLLVAGLLRAEMFPKAISGEQYIKLHTTGLDLLNTLIEEVGKDSECYNDKPSKT